MNVTRQHYAPTIVKQYMNICLRCCDNKLNTYRFVSCFSLAKNEDTLKHILGTIPSDSLGKGLEKYIRLESIF